LFLASLAFHGMQFLFGDFTMPVVVMGMGAALAIVVALVSGLPPAWRARQLNIVDALAGR
jgi:putative ABC transport system permease protein